LSKEHEQEQNDFIRQIIKADIESGKHGGRTHTRFPPEPNGYLHIGHAKSICLNFGIPQEFENAKCNLRFDDTNPAKEDTEYVDSIREDVAWLGGKWDDREFFASDYFEKFYNYATELIENGKAYVCSLNAEEVREYRGTLTEPGRESPYRDRTVEENLKLFKGMRDGEFADGEHSLRAKIDMSSGNINLRDPAIYRIRKVHHHRTGDDWCIYPMYDFAHCISDALEGITHSLCTLEFEDHRPLYDWFLENISIDCHPRQIEFARLNLIYTVLSKRKLLKLVEEGHVDGWNDPRMPTISGFRRRGYTPSAIREFCKRIGLAKSDSTIDIDVLNFCQREELNKSAERRMAILDPLKLTIQNYPDDQVEMMEAKNNPENPEAGTREIPFSKHLLIEKSDFLEDAPKKWFRFAPGKEVRLLHGYYVTCVDVVKNEDGEITELICTYDPETRGGWFEGRKVKGTVHWLSEQHAVKGTVRLYNHLFTKENPDEGGDFLANLNPNSVEINEQCLFEPSLAEAEPGKAIQFVRNGYFCIDPFDSSKEKPVFNRTVALKDSWSKKKR